MAQRKNIAESQPAAELEPVQLDTPPEDPADVILRRITEFQDTLPERAYKWCTGDPAPEWMGPRPVWADDHWQEGDRFLPNTCFWQSIDVELPAQFMYGTTTPDKRFRVFGAYRAFIRQAMNDRDPHIGVDTGKPWNRSEHDGDRFHLRLTLSETRQLIAALELLVDIAENGGGAQ